MRITTLTLAASLALSLSGAAWAQGAPGGNGSGGNVTGGSTTGSSKSEPGNMPANGGAMKGDSGSMEKGGSMSKDGSMEKGESTSKDGGAMKSK